MLRKLLLAGALACATASAEPRLGPPAPALGQGARSVATRTGSAALAARSGVHALAVRTGSDSQAAPTSANVVARERTRAIVLLYHSFDVGPQPLGLSSRRFESHLEWLAQSGVAVVPLSALIEFLEGRRLLPERVAVITIDDGHRSTYEKAFPLLKKHQMPFTLGLPSALVTGKKRTISWSEVRKMVDSGLCEIASHGHRHRRLGPLDARRTHEELVVSRELIERETGVRPIAYFYPLGAHESPAPEKAKAAGYRAAFTATGGAIAHGRFSLQAIPRTTVLHGDGAGKIGWLFSPDFLERLPRVFTASSDTR